MHCNLWQPDDAQSHICFNFVARAKVELAQSIRCRLRAFYCLYVTLRCDLELWPRDLDLWPWTCTVDRLRHGQTLYQIWAKFGQSAVELLQFECLSDHVSRAPLWCGKFKLNCTKFKLSQAVRSWNVTIFFTLIRHVTLWPWTLTRWPWKLVVDLVSRGHSLY